MTLRTRVLGTCLLSAAFAATMACGGANRTITVAQDITIRFDSPQDRSPLRNPSPRLAAAAKEVRELLGHPLVIEISGALAPQYRDELDPALTHALEELATALDRENKRDPAVLATAKRHLARIVVRYDPGATDDPWPRIEGSDTFVVTCVTNRKELIFVGAIVSLLREMSNNASTEEFARLDPTSVAPEQHKTYVRWLRGELDSRHAGMKDTDRKVRDIQRIGLGLRFTKTPSDAKSAEELLRFLVETALRDLAMGRYATVPGVADVTNAMATWLESAYESMPIDHRARVADILFAHGVKDPRLLECAFTLGLRIVDAWRKAGHPLQHTQHLTREQEAVICPHPKDERDARSLGPRCAGGIVRLALATDAGQRRLGEVLATSKDPLLVEQVMVNAGYSTYGGGERKLFALVRAIEADGPSLRMALKVMAEDHAVGATLDVWKAELRRLWLAQHKSRGSVLYVLVHLDPYDHKKIDFSDFVGDFGALVTVEEASAYFDEGYRALSLAPILWPSFAPDFSRASLVLPRLDSYLDDGRVRHFSMRDPHEALRRIGSRLCDEGAKADMLAFSTYFAQRVRERPGRGLDSISEAFNPKTCDPPCAGGRGPKCVPRRTVDETTRRKGNRQ